MTFVQAASSDGCAFGMAGFNKGSNSEKNVNQMQVWQNRGRSNKTCKHFSLNDSGPFCGHSMGFRRSYDIP